MLDFPKSTEFNKRIPKQKFYEKIDVSPALKRVFVEQIKIIYWRNKLAASTMNVAAGDTVSEIEIIEIRLTEPELDEAVLRQIDKEIPYHILYVLSFEGKYQAWIGYKEASASGTKAFKVGKYYHTDWVPEDKLVLTIDGLNMDAIYDNFVRQIAGDALQTESGETLKETIQRDEQKQAIQKQIEALESKIRKEKQFNRQVKMNTELKALKCKLEVLKNEG